MRSLLFSLVFLFGVLSCSAQYPVKLNQKILVDFANSVRANGCNCGGKYFPPAKPLVWNKKLEQAAQNHSNNMYSKKFFSHTGQNGSTMIGRIQAVGYDWAAAAENIAMNYATERAVMQAWMNNPKHCENIMNGLYTEMGVSNKGPYWTMLLGCPK